MGLYERCILHFCHNIKLVLSIHQAYSNLSWSSILTFTLFNPAQVSIAKAFRFPGKRGYFLTTVRTKHRRKMGIETVFLISLFTHKLYIVFEQTRYGRGGRNRTERVVYPSSCYRIERGFRVQKAGRSMYFVVNEIGLASLINKQLLPVNIYNSLILWHVVML